MMGIFDQTMVFEGYPNTFDGRKAGLPGVIVKEKKCIIWDNSGAG
jgi:hypothetical protein